MATMIYSPYVAMILVQLAYGGSNILMKLALERGLNQFVFVVYRHVIATLLLGPFAYLLERKERPPLSLKIASKIFVLSSLGTTVHLNLYYAGLTYTSATVGSAMSNVIPCLTFLIALLLGMEKVTMKSLSGRAKVVGTVICVFGSLTFTFWKGSRLNNGLSRRPLISMHGGDESGLIRKVHIAEENWIKGSALILMSNVVWSAWLILQAVVFKDYPARLSLNTLICFFASLQSSIIAFFFARDPSLWKLEWNVQLWTIIYCVSPLSPGVVISAGVYYLQTWIISHRGPVFAAMFSPLLLVIVGIFSAIAFAEQLHLGSLIGACLIIAGLYSVLWGKRKEHQLAADSIHTKNNVDNNNTKELEISIRDYQPDGEKQQQK